MKGKTERILLETEVLRVPGLELFGRNRSRSAQNPLETHVHPGCVELVVLLKGKELYWADGIHYTMSGGEVFFTHPDQPHGNGQTEQGISDFLWFQISMQPVEGFLLLATKQGRALQKRLCGISNAKWQVDRNTQQLLEWSFSAFQGLEKDASLYAAALFVAALTRLLEQEAVHGQEKGMSPGNQPIHDGTTVRQPTSGRTQDPVIGNVLAHICAHLSDPLVLADLALMAGLSESAFKRRFRDVVGQTPRETINRMRIDLAKQWLVEGKSITETAMGLGFSGSDYFSVVFRRYTAINPSEYVRRANRRN